MAIKWKHDDSATMYFCTFTCYQWLPLIEIVKGYDMMYKWFDLLKQQGYGTIAYVIMPNHVHTILYFPNPGFDLNKIIGNAKRFMAYEIIKRLEQLNRQDILDYLINGLTTREKGKGHYIKYLLTLLMRKVFTTKSFLIRSLSIYILILLAVNGNL